MSSPFIETLAKTNLDDLKKYCFSLTKSKWDGEDLFQEVLLKGILYFLNAEPHDYVKPFLIRTAKNLWIDDCRARQRRRRKLLMQRMPVCYSDPDYFEVRNLLEWLAERIPRRNIEVLLLSDYFGYKMQDIADKLGFTVSTVKSTLFRTRQRLGRWKDDAGADGVKRKALGFDVELWSRAIVQERPHDIGMEP